VVPRFTVPDAVAGKIIINTHANAQSLDAHCGRCKAKTNRRFLARPGGGEHHQGRPLGSLIPWLDEDCHGDRAWHRSRYTDAALPNMQRVAVRAWAVSLGTLDAAFAKERPARPQEQPSGEPVPLA
jgi:hypothetical protein